MQTPRLFDPGPLTAPGPITLGPQATRHAQVLRLQPGDGLTLFDGGGGEWSARVLRMARDTTAVELLEQHRIEREAPRGVTLAVALVANDRMDALVEKATELGAAALWPLHSRRGVARLDGERAQRRLAHWIQVARAACEQCGRNRVPVLAAPQPLPAWLDGLPPSPPTPSRLLLSLAADALPLPALLRRLAPAVPTLLLSGPEGGLDPGEEGAARAAGFIPVSLGPRVLRADTAPLAALALLTCDPTA